MKYIIYIVAAFILFVGYYMMLSLIGLFFGNTYQECTSNMTWFILYTTLMSWWLVLVSLDPLTEYYRNKENKLWDTQEN